LKPKAAIVARQDAGEAEFREIARFCSGSGYEAHRYHASLARGFREFRLPLARAARRPLVMAEVHSPAPRQVFLFSGHMIDAPERPTPRFPIEKAPLAARRIGQALDAFAAGPQDLALAQGASGGDILFLEACRERGVRMQLMQPFPEPEFIERSILPATDGARWRERYLALRAALAEPPRMMPEAHDAGSGAPGPYERCNLWLLDTAMSWGAERLRFICLWNGAGGDGPGGTAFMVEAVRHRRGHVTWIDTRTL
jgi:hypothetical protein